MALDPSQHTVAELREEIERIDDPGELQAIMDAEREDKDRKTARRLIEDRLDAIAAGKNLRATALEDASKARDRLDALLSKSR